ncbi:MAG: hypothetical protein JHC93_06625 [Parachlamydiales bacterium]|nr:hypothetical protein [Parachlamydiales bacterium]
MTFINNNYNYLPQKNLELPTNYHTTNQASTIAYLLNSEQSTVFPTDLKGVYWSYREVIYLKNYIEKHIHYSSNMKDLALRIFKADNQWYLPGRDAGAICLKIKDICDKKFKESKENLSRFDLLYKSKLDSIFDDYTPACKNHKWTDTETKDLNFILHQIFGTGNKFDFLNVLVKIKILAYEADILRNISEDQFVKKIFDITRSSQLDDIIKLYKRNY